MQPIRSVSILMPTYQGLEFLSRVLAALAEQRLKIPWDLSVIDSSSTDGTWELLESCAADFPVPFTRQCIESVEFDHGDTRNLLAAQSKGDLLVFLTQDAIVMGSDWLAQLVKNFNDDKVGAAYCRNLPRPDAELLTRVFSQTDPGYLAGRRETSIEDHEAYGELDPGEKRLLYNFNDVASAVRRELWERHPFPRTAFGEDILMARALLEAGYTVVYDDQATVEHSHDYTPTECRTRAEIDGRFNAEWLDRIAVASKKDARTLVGRQLEIDERALRADGLASADLARELKRAKALREATFMGLYEGGRSSVRFPASRLLQKTQLKILYVVHGFPPDTWAGTEIYTFNLASEMQRLGHSCTVLCRVPATAEEPDFHLETSQFQGLRVLRLVHRLDHKSLRQSYQHDEAEEAFARVLAREAPDLVHFQHLIHTSAGLVQVAREQKLATVITCHDYWGLCARVQLIRPDGVICEENQGAGCFLCVKEKGQGEIGRLARLDALASPLLDALEGGLRRGSQLVGKSEGRWQGFGEMRARHDFVTAAYAAADLRISPSRFLRDRYLASGKFDPHTFIFSDNGMRTDHVEALKKQPDREGRVRFGFVGSLVWYKGGEVLMRAMAELDRPRALLNVYGPWDPEGDEHHGELERLARGAAVEFKGRFDNSRLSEVYSQIDVLIVPSIWFENSPITIHEAYLTRTPVLASDIGGMAEFVRDGVDGLHFKVADPSDLAAKMRRFVDEPGLLAELSQDFMSIKTLEQNALETEFRYRGLCSRVRGAASPARMVLMRATGAMSALRLGAVEDQGASLALLRPEPGTAIEFDLEGSGGGRREVRVRQQVVGAESEIVLGGILKVDGETLATLSDVRGEGEDREDVSVFPVDLPAGAARLRLEPGPGRFLRVATVEIVRTDTEEASR
ncbi:MAG: glycosyltransferase [bacterium]